MINNSTPDPLSAAINHRETAILTRLDQAEKRDRHLSLLVYAPALLCLPSVLFIALLRFLGM